MVHFEDDFLIRINENEGNRCKLKSFLDREWLEFVKALGKFNLG
jgi:hypothetical protein